MTVPCDWTSARVDVVWSSEGNETTNQTGCADQRRRAERMEGQEEETEDDY